MQGQYDVNADREAEEGFGGEMDGGVESTEPVVEDADVLDLGPLSDRQRPCPI